jgi:hypothetical protein
MHKRVGFDPDPGLDPREVLQIAAGPRTDFQHATLHALEQILFQWGDKAVVPRDQGTIDGSQSTLPQTLQATQFGNLRLDAPSIK